MDAVSKPINYNPMLRGNHGKLVRSGRSLKEGTAKSTAGNQTIHRRTSSIRKLKLEEASHIVCVGSKADQLGAKETMGKDSKGIEASSGNWFGSCETHTKNLSGG
jgi:hypothetical protein